VWVAARLGGRCGAQASRTGEEAGGGEEEASAGGEKARERECGAGQARRWMDEGESAGIDVLGFEIGRFVVVVFDD